MILVIRIAGLVKIPYDVQDALFRMRLRRKYSAVLIKDTSETRKLLAHVRNTVAFGKLNKEDTILLLEQRGRASNKKPFDAKKIADQLDKKSLEELGIKPFFRLHPPRGGIEARIHYPIGKGVLGDHKEKIGELLRRML
ncbi:uL30 family ribosomal protein [Candidatus Pacearchaeota archaeon]|nr:uL30 family ribosomal protein [Candidatus Pacearchaeota archaeon]